MGHSWTKKWVTVRKMRYRYTKYDTGRKMCHSHKNVSQLEKCFAVRKYASIRKLRYNYKNGLGALRKMLDS